MNKDKKKNDTVFVDLDGTLVYQNYDPENTPDVLIQGTYKYLVKMRQKGAVIILTTARDPIEVQAAFNWLPILKEVINDVICNIGTGRRILINDRKIGMPNKAIAMNVMRDVGLGKA